DLRRVETLLALRKLKRASIPVAVVAHSGASMRDPYRFSPEELSGTELRSWTRTAASDYGARELDPPRRTRAAPFRRITRRIRRTVTQTGSINVGVVITTAAEYAAPEHDLADLLDALGRLISAAPPSVQFVARLRAREDEAEVWRSVVADMPNVRF